VVNCDTGLRRVLVVLIGNETQSTDGNHRARAGGPVSEDAIQFALIRTRDHVTRSIMATSEL
jgi:hypothetical protein